MTVTSHRFIETNRIRMHIAEEGSGPLVILCHGFPECWYSWRHQLSALAGAGFRAVAPDQRGYGQTDRPESVEAYHMFQLVGDIVGLVDALGERHAFIAGHDWGASVATYCALLRPDIFRAVVLLSIPYRPRSWADIRPTEAMRQRAGEQDFYQLYFQEPGRAEAELAADVPRTMRGFLYSCSGDATPEKRWRPFFPRTEGILDTIPEPDTLPPWLTEKDVDYYAGEFARTGFRGALNWYRNLDGLWRDTTFLTGAKISQPALFIAGELDVGIAMYRRAFETMEKGVPNLRKKVLLPGAGHWTQQERPEEVNRLIIEFLTGL